MVASTCAVDKRGDGGGGKREGWVGGGVSGGSWCDWIIVEVGICGGGVMLGTSSEVEVG